MNFGFLKKYFFNFTDIVKMKWRSVYTAKMFKGKILWIPN